jgi:3-oxoacyl-[acyl-carrier-protein] synthase-1
VAKGAIRNDGYHISSPSKVGEGSFRALRQILEGVDPEEIAVVNAHGTATLFNDEMESVAIDRAGLGGVAVNSLKGYYGHTMGAAGILETIITMRALDEGLVLATKGYENLGVSRPVQVTKQNLTTQKRTFVKMISGFGGCNAAMLLKH